jgi:hypothetical protein
MTTIDVTVQRHEALTRANEVRIANAITIGAIKRVPSMVGGLRATARLLREADMDGPTGALPVYRVVFAPRWMGADRGLPMLTRAGIYADRPLRRLTERQRVALAQAMEVAATVTAKRAGR